jgi:hypothetical protein
LIGFNGMTDGRMSRPGGGSFAGGAEQEHVLLARCVHGARGFLPFSSLMKKFTLLYGGVALSSRARGPFTMWTQAGSLEHAFLLSPIVYHQKMIIAIV